MLENPWLHGLKDMLVGAVSVKLDCSWKKFATTSCMATFLVLSFEPKAKFSSSYCSRLLSETMSFTIGLSWLESSVCKNHDHGPSSLV